jgi:hypothetical protein
LSSRIVEKKVLFLQQNDSAFRNLACVSEFGFPLQPLVIKGVHLSTAYTRSRLNPALCPPQDGAQVGEARCVACSVPRLGSVALAPRHMVARPSETRQHYTIDRLHFTKAGAPLERPSTRLSLGPNIVSTTQSRRPTPKYKYEASQTHTPFFFLSYHLRRSLQCKLSVSYHPHSFFTVSSCIDYSWDTFILYL